MPFNPKHNRDSSFALGMPEDDKATDVTSRWSMISLLKGILDKLTTGIATTPPAGAASEAKQDTGNTSLASIDTKLSTGNSSLSTIIGHVDGLEALLTTQAGFLDGIEGNQATQTTSLQLLDDVIFVDDSAFTPATSKIAVVGFVADEATPDIVDEGDVGVARMTLDRKQHVVAELASSSMRDNGVALTPKFAIIDAATSGNNTLVASVSSKKIRVLALYLVAAGTVNVRFEGGADGTALSGQMNLVANTGFVLPFNPTGWFETAVTTLLNLELSAAISVDGSLVYVEV